MADKSARRSRKPKGKNYCDTPGTSCWYDATDICVNCEREKGWRKS